MKLIYPNYSNSILNVSHTILDFYNAKPRYPLINELKERLTPNIKHVCLVLLDGMGINLIESYLSRDSFIRKNLVKTITSVFPPTTVAATNAVLTTSPSFESGYLGWIQYFKDIDTNLTVFTNQDYYDENKKFSESYRDIYLKQNLIFDYIKEANPKIRTYELFPEFRIDGYKTFQDQMKRLLEITRKNEENFSYVYWTEPDGLQHDFGIDSPIVKEELLKLNDELFNFSKALTSDTLLIVIADHGLVNVEPIELYKNDEIMNLLERNPSMEPRATNFFVKKGLEDEFKSKFNNNYSKYYKLMSKDELIESNILGTGNKHKLLDSFLGDFIAIAISNKFFKFKENAFYKAHHAGLTKGEMEVPLVIFNKSDY